MTVKELIKNYYDNLSPKNDAWQMHLSEDIVFTDAGLNIHEKGRDAFITSFNKFLRAVEDVRIKQIITEGTDACTIVSYDFVSPKGSKLTQDVAEIWKVEAETLRSLTIYFDITAFRNFMVR